MFSLKKRQDARFGGVAFFLIILGMVIFAVGGSLWWLNVCYGFHYVYPAMKAIAGLVVLGLGYILLELEMMRIDKN